MMLRRLSSLAIVLCLASAPADADDSSWDTSVDVALQSRIFPGNARWSGQDSALGQFSAAVSAEFRWRNAAANQRASVIPYARLDATDEERSLVDLREAYWALEGDSYELLVGSNTVFWGVTESVHLVDIINQTDFVADIDGEDKLGQPMVNLELQRDWGLISLYVLPFFRERTFAGVDGRLRTPSIVDTDRTQYESSAKENHVDYAVRYSHYFGDIDIGLSFFSGTSREPRFLPATNAAAFLPVYDQISQFSIDVQYTKNAWLWKLEAMSRRAFSETFAALVGGFEYTFYQVRESDADVGLLIEYQHDDRNSFEPITLADNDVFVATRLAFNDTQDTAILAGIGLDVDTGESFFNVEAERRIGDDYVLEIRARAFSGASPSDLSYAFSKDDYLQLELSRYF